jgi:hypothetical protein
MRVTEAAAVAIDKAQKDAISLGATSTIMQTEGIVGQSMSVGNGLVSALTAVISKLEIIVRIGDKLAAVRMYFICLPWLIQIRDSPLRQHRVESSNFCVHGAAHVFPAFKQELLTGNLGYEAAARDGR